jgi:hypothetical protein
LSAGRGSSAERTLAWRIPMLDLILIAAGLAFFALSVGYVVACDRL